jgi:hypothetical protein
MRVEVRGWFLAAWLSIAALVAVGVWMTPRWIVACDATFAWIEPEPDGWREWPLATSEEVDAVERGGCWGGRFSFEQSTPMFQGRPSGAPLDDWVRRDPSGEIFVGAGPPLGEEAPKERYLGAFRRTPGLCWGFTSKWAPVSLAVLGLLMGAIATGIGVARRRLQKATRLARSVHDAYARVASDPPTYRRSPVGADAGSAEACLREGARSAKRALVWGLVVAAAILLISVAGGTVFLVHEFYRLVL